MKDFLLPEKWCIKDSAEVSAWAKRTFFCEGYVSDKYLCVDQRHFPKNNCYHFYDHKYSYAYTEITFEQFKQYVLGMKEEQKEIVGWRLKEECRQYESSAVKIVQQLAYNKTAKTFAELDDKTDAEIDFMDSSLSEKLLKQAGVLDLWFTPVFANKTPQIVVNGYKAEFFSKHVKFGCAEISKDQFIDLYETMQKGYYPSSNREVESVTIGKGTFTKQQIREIAAYYTK